MRAVYKYLLHTTDQQDVRVPVGARPLTVQMQNGGPCLWALVDPNEIKRESLDIRTHGTGHYFDDDGYDYIATYQLANGSLMFHVFCRARLREESRKAGR